MNQLSTIIYNEMNYIISYCINQNIDINTCDQNVLGVVSENIGMIFLGATIIFLQHYGLIEEKNELIKDYESYVKLFFGNQASYKEALQKVYDIVKLLERNFYASDENKTINNWRIRIREILSRQNKSHVGETSYFFGVGLLYDDKKMTDKLLKHIKMTKNFIMEMHNEE